MEKFVEELFPSDISYGALGGPKYLTEIVKVNNGEEFRNVNWKFPRAEYYVSHGAKTRLQIEQLMAFYRSKRGRAIGFRFKDWQDFQGRNQLIAVGDGVKRHFQLIKKYGNVQPEIREICKPVPGTVVVFVDDVEVKFDVDSRTGIVSLAKPAKKDAKITANFDFHVPVRFDNDWLAVSEVSQGKFSWQDIKLVEVQI